MELAKRKIEAIQRTVIISPSSHNSVGGWYFFNIVYVLYSIVVMIWSVLYHAENKIYKYKIVFYGSILVVFLLGTATIHAQNNVVEIEIDMGELSIPGYRLLYGNAAYRMEDFFFIAKFAQTSATIRCWASHIYVVR